MSLRCFARLPPIPPPPPRPSAFRPTHPLLSSCRQLPLQRIWIQTSSTHKLLATEQRIRQNGVSWITAAVVTFAIGATVGIGLGISRASSTVAPAEPSATASSFIPTQPLQGLYLDMAASMPPGRPGNLTPEQEVKLRELWQLALQVFGVTEPLPISHANGKSPPLSRTSSETSGSDPSKRKKSRMSFLKRKNKEVEEVESNAAAGSGSATPSSVSEIADGMKDDKHGLAKSFKAAIADTSPAELRAAFWSMVKHDHPDALLLRFLRARKWDVNAALVMAISALHWRVDDANVDSDIMLRGEEGMLNLMKSSDAAEKKEGEDFMQQIRMGKSYLHGFDKEGRPICYVRVRLHRPGEQSESSLERFTVYTIETARIFLRPPVDTATIVFDMTDFGLANMDYTPVKFMIKCFEANYPESLGAVLVHKAPWVFQGIWRVIKGWLDPVVAGKVHFTNNIDDLSNFIEKGNIVKDLSGPNPWEYEYVEPREGENAAMRDTTTKQKLEKERQELSKKYEEVVLEWISSAEHSRPTSAPAPDAKAAAELRTRRDDVAAQLRKNYWQLDPYVRARSVYDRIGELRPELSGDGQPEVLSRTATNATLAPRLGIGAQGRPSVDSIAQSFYSTRETFDDDVD